MTTKKNKLKIKSKAVINNNVRKRKARKKKKTIKFWDRKEINYKLLILVTFLTGVLLILSSYAWLSASLDVKVKFFNLSVSTDNGLFISLDGIDFTDSIEISMNSIVNDLKATYPNNTSQWTSGGLWPASSIGIKNADRDKFDMYTAEVSHFKYKRTNRKFIDTKIINEDIANASNSYIAFDLFFKNVSGSPKSDNLYFDEGTLVDFDEETPDNIKESMTGIINSIRFGILKIGSVALKSDVKTIQNQKCSNNCQPFIYEPNSSSHSDFSINKAQDIGVDLRDNTYVPTYAVISEGKFLEHVNGLEGTGVPLDSEHFAKQKTITDFSDPIFQVPNGITKVRIYIWIEGQDIDSLETNSEGADLYISLGFVKDLAGYE